jgi:hypothetical protein
VAAAAVFSESDVGRGLQRWIPSPAKWLSDGRFSDDPAAWQRPDDNGRGHRDIAELLAELDAMELADPAALESA